MSQTNIAAELKALKITVKCLADALDPAAKAKFYKSIGTEIQSRVQGASPHGSESSNQEIVALRAVAASLGWPPKV